MSNLDALTALKNRVALHEEVKSWFERPDWCALHVDLDRFKRFNDFYGLPAGDARLVATAQMLQAALPDAEIYRISGDEFVCLIEKSLACATELARQFVAEAHEMSINYGYGNTCGGSVCIAVAHVTTHAANWDELWSALFQAMYACKFRGNNQVGIATNKRAR